MQRGSKRHNLCKKTTVEWYLVIFVVHFSSPKSPHSPVLSSDIPGSTLSSHSGASDSEQVNNNLWQLYYSLASVLVIWGLEYKYIYLYINIGCHYKQDFIGSEYRSGSGPIVLYKEKCLIMLTSLKAISVGPKL